MKLSVKERFLIMGLLPHETNFSTLKVIRKFEEEVGFSEQEIKDFEIKIGDSQNYLWSIQKETEMGEKETIIPEIIESLIKKNLRKLDEEEKLTQDHFTICEKFGL